ncbi:MAG: prolyl oligopeptidase family serine peptidase [Bacteroidetes bacterium]|jgi:dipeptidyl-peptidase 4|nr:prolyl oligopeptidase family serine peptidase [Bacteroidota bacterium]MBT6686069.1 prolyl oligopeptidase family serine peptidase [Bacteroidota bacterium]MBT7145177.1 prolyl oligopeptidase family serine peptidase [Bacteroidota bacterium]MBT7491933.1 prolyl oligopeptidase family serine peptidase [Bacteroidota bacterium]
MIKYTILILVSCLSLSIVGQDLKPNFVLAKENSYLKLINRYNSNNVNPYWVSDRQFIYIKKVDNEEFDLFLIDTEKAIKIKQENTIVKTNDYTYSFTHDSLRYAYNSYSNQISKFSESTINSISENSPNNDFSIYVKKHNLYITINENGKLSQISNDGETFYSFKANIDYNYTNELYNKDTLPLAPNISWSPNSEFFIALRTDVRDSKDNWVINSISEPRPVLTTFKQRNPGDAFPLDEVWVYNVSNKSFHEINLKRWENENYRFLGWSKNGENCFIQRINRQQNKCDILSLSKNGEYDLLIEERPNAVISQNEFRELSDEKYLWLSRRDGWGHLYLYDFINKTTSQLTKGKFNIDKIVCIDTLANNKLYFTAFGREQDVNPYFSFLYSLNLENGNVKLLSPESANHEVFFSPDNKNFIDVFSRIDLPHKSQLRNYEGKLLLELESADILQLVANKWKSPESFTVKAADSTTNLWGVMWKPFDFDPNKKYPIITYVYPGPQDNFVPVEFFRELNNVHLAQYGFIVVMCDTRGSSYKRSKSFSEYYRSNLRDYPLEDNKFMIEQLAARYPFIDSSKIGIWGGSSGGFMAASAILKYPDFYKVSVSRAGQHDPRVFHTWWTDVFNTPLYKNEADSIFTNISIAKNLKGKLFIIHGEIDTNVHPSNSARLANELMKSGKYFDYLVVPGGSHAWSHNWQYVQKRIWLYFVENLLDNRIENINIMEY